MPLTELLPKSPKHDIRFSFQHDEPAAMFLELVVQVVQSLQEIPHTVVANQLCTCPLITP